jgi:hypothetical protein
MTIRLPQLFIFPTRFFIFAARGALAQRRFLPAIKRPSQVALAAVEQL